MDTVYVSWAYVEDTLLADFIFPQDGDGNAIYRCSSDVEIKSDKIIEYSSYEDYQSSQTKNPTECGS